MTKANYLLDLHYSILQVSLCPIAVLVRPGLKDLDGCYAHDAEGQVLLITTVCTVSQKPGKRLQSQ